MVLIGFILQVSMLQDITKQVVLIIGQQQQVERQVTLLLSPKQ